MQLNEKPALEASEQDQIGPPMNRTIQSQIDIESVRVYEWIQMQYSARKVDDPLFQFVFRSFYRLDSAGLTPVWKKAYFQLMERRETDLKNILMKLHKYKNSKGQHTYQLSFASKLLHTQNPHLPIYDANVAKALNLPTRDASLEGCLTAYDQLKERFDAAFVKRRAEIRKLKKLYPTLTDEKVLDLLLWGKG